MTDINYVASLTAKDFHNSPKFVRAIIGPLGSGKSVACVMEMVRLALLQEPHNGVRSTRFCIIRNTYRELLDTTMATFHDWIPKELGVTSVLNSKFTLKQKLNDGTKINAEFLFRALDKPSDIKKLLSLELTYIFMNECREIPKQVLDMGIGRVGRYPAKRDGGPTRWGVIMDTNPPDSDSWFYKTFEEDLPENHAIFHQPSGLSEHAENVENLPPEYYTNMIHGKTKEWIKVFVEGMYGFVTDDKPVYPEYRDEIHCIDSYEPTSATIYIGIDFGLTPAAVFGQLTASGRMVLFDELVTFDMGAMSFGKLLREMINSKYPLHDMEIYADPAGEQRAQTDEITPFMVLSNQGVEAVPTYTNDPIIRREAVADYLMRLDFSGNPAFAITKNCKILRKAFAGGYKYKRVQVSGEERYVDKPDKGKYSHVSDGCQYMFLGAVGGANVVGGFDNAKPLEYHDQGLVT